MSVCVLSSLAADLAGENAPFAKSTILRKILCRGKTVQHPWYISLAEDFIVETMAEVVVSSSSWREGRTV
jgi:hypothetical protein